MALLVAALGAWKGGSEAPAAPAAPTAGAAPAAPAAPATAAANNVSVSVGISGHIGRPIDDQLLGLSFESSTLNNGYRYDAIGNLVQLMKNLGSSSMRFGGDTADTSYTDTNSLVLDSVDRLAKATGWQVIWTENLLKFNAARVTADAKALNAHMGGELLGIACGNEPDLYAEAHLRPANYSAANYLAAVNGCYRAIRKGDARAPIEGPDTGWNPLFLTASATKDAGTLAALGQHYYGLGCLKTGTKAATELPPLMSNALSGTEGKKIAGYVADAKSAHGPLLLTETNSACNGGVSGLSNAYASALWAVDFSLIAAEEGAGGLNFHGGLNTLCGGYTVLCQVGKETYRPQPIYYGLLFAHLFRTGKFLPVQVVSSVKTQHVVAFGVRPPAGGNERIMVENMGTEEAHVTLHVGGYRGTAALLHLTGPGPLSTSGVEIQGATVAANGTLTPGKPSIIQCTAGGCAFSLSPYSAVLATFS